MVGLLAACGGGAQHGGASVSHGDPSSVASDAPTVEAISPTIWHAGDTVSVVGRNFIADSEGTTLVRFGGQFVDDGGTTTDVDMEVHGSSHGSSKLTFVFEPGDVGGFGDAPGTFTGQFKVTNVSNSGDEVASESENVTVVVGPSIVVQQLWPVSESCSAARVTDTLNGNQLEMTLSASGLGEPPIAIDVAWVDAVGEPREQQATITGTSVSLVVDPGTLSDGDVPSDGKGATLYVPVSFSITATDSTGHTLQRRVVVNVREDYEVTYNGNSRVVQVFDPEPVSGCLPGGQTGTSFTYSESTSETKSRSFTLSSNVKVDVWILSLGFGFSVTEGVSSTSSTTVGASHSVFPHWFGAFYRQTSQLEKVGEIYRYDACGVKTHVGSATVTDWGWSPGFNQEKTDCPPLPSPLMAGTQLLPD